MGILVQLSCTFLDFPHRYVIQSAAAAGVPGPAHFHSTINN